LGAGLSLHQNAQLADTLLFASKLLDDFIVDFPTNFGVYGRLFDYKGLEHFVSFVLIVKYLCDFMDSLLHSCGCEGISITTMLKGSVVVMSASFAGAAALLFVIIFFLT